MKLILKLVIFVALLALLCNAYAASAPVVGYLPNNNTVKGFRILGGSLLYAKGDDLTNIYDGGYEVYTKNGVIDAARQMYQNKKEYVEITIHTMKSGKAATDFLKYWQKENKAKTSIKSGASNGFLVSKPNVGAYYIKGKYFYTVTALGSDPKAAQYVKAFVTAIDKKIK